jgi:hypothetical protein
VKKDRSPLWFDCRIAFRLVQPATGTALKPKDTARDEVLKELATDKQPLEEAAKEGALPKRDPAAASSSKDKTRWN